MTFYSSRHTKGWSSLIASSFWIWGEASLPKQMLLASDPGRVPANSVMNWIEVYGIMF